MSESLNHQLAELHAERVATCTTSYLSLRPPF